MQKELGIHIEMKNYWSLFNEICRIVATTLPVEGGNCLEKAEMYILCL